MLASLLFHSCFYVSLIEGPNILLQTFCLSVYSLLFALNYQSKAVKCAKTVCEFYPYKCKTKEPTIFNKYPLYFHTFFHVHYNKPFETNTVIVASIFVQVKLINTKYHLDLLGISIITCIILKTSFL